MTGYKAASNSASPGTWTKGPSLPKDEGDGVDHLTCISSDSAGEDCTDQCKSKCLQIACDAFAQRSGQCWLKRKWDYGESGWKTDSGGFEWHYIQRGSGPAAVSITTEGEAEAYSAYNLFLKEWSNINNEFNVDFQLFSSYNDAVSNSNPWKYCDFG